MRAGMWLLRSRRDFFSLISLCLHRGLEWFLRWKQAFSILEMWFGEWFSWVMNIIWNFKMGGLFCTCHL
jgi:hypothetical protein